MFYARRRSPEQFPSPFLSWLSALGLIIVAPMVLFHVALMLRVNFYT